MTIVDTDVWRRPPPTTAEQRQDVWLAAVVLLGGVVSVLLTNSLGASAFGSALPLAEQILWAVLLAAPLVVRRRYPATVTLVVGTLFVCAQARQYGEGLVQSITLFAAIYTLGAWGRDRTVARWVRLGVIGVMFGWLGISMFAVHPPPADFPGASGPLDPVVAAALSSIGFNALFFLGAYYFGDLAWNSARRQARLRSEQEALRASRAENARQAVVAERVRIARDLHDVVAHHVSVMGIQAAAARRAFDGDREVSRSSLAVIERTARTAIDELRGLLGVLRADSEHRDTVAGGAEDAASPGLHQLPDLVHEIGTTGLHVDFATYGQPRPVADAVALSAYRIVQEALTNTVKHAAASRADVRIRYLERELEVEVTDNGRGEDKYRAGAHSTASDAGEDGSERGGLGLLGIRERVAVHGGTLETGQASAGGYLVRARLPAPADTHNEPEAGIAT